MFGEIIEFLQNTILCDLILLMHFNKIKRILKAYNDNNFYR